ncbi:excisionase family DNA-binding protein [Kitasatospora sp. NPDC058032]|uniref:excisionase family DNA-binding protein n=1 Tax=Kitasatospora sp. NPDC058032 TaxID=3346307 RepID=UPI0036DBEB01
MPTQYLTVAKVAERLGTTERFVRRLISERRIAFVKMGAHVRISATSLDAYIAAGTVPAVRSRRDRHGGGV